MEVQIDAIPSTGGDATVANTKLLPLAMLYVDRQREIDGITRLQKLVFLAQEEDERLDDTGGFDFKAYDYGPYSKDLYNTLDTLEERNLINCEKQTTPTGNEKFNYSLTDEGYRLVRQAMVNDDDYQDLLDAAQQVKQEFNDQSLEQLLQYVYNKYPKYTKNSKLDL